VREALDFTSKLLEKPADGPKRHVSGTELLEGIRRYALQEFGPMSLTVLNTWGITTTADFGEIVFHLVEVGLLGKTEEDRREDFADGYNFHEAFARPFLPKSSKKAAAEKRSTTPGRGDIGKTRKRS
jgi:uncharacterized repeat protein (TIGR04138 family)